MFISHPDRRHFWVDSPHGFLLATSSEDDGCRCLYPKVWNKKWVFSLFFLKVRFWIDTHINNSCSIWKCLHRFLSWSTSHHASSSFSLLTPVVFFPTHPTKQQVCKQKNPSPKKNPSVSRISRKCTWMMPKTRCWVDFEHNWALWSERGAEAANFWIVREFLDLKGRWKFVVFFCFLSLKTHHSFFAVKNKLGMAEFLIFHFYFWMVFIGGEKMIQHFFWEL